MSLVMTLTICVYIVLLIDHNTLYTLHRKVLVTLYTANNKDKNIT